MVDRDRSVDTYLAFPSHVQQERSFSQNADRCPVSVFLCVSHQSTTTSCTTLEGALLEI